MRSAIILATLFFLPAISVAQETQDFTQPGAFGRMLNNHALNTSAKYSAEQICKGRDMALIDFVPEGNDPSSYIATCSNGADSVQFRIKSTNYQRQ